MVSISKAISIFLLCLISSSAYAGAWVQDSGKALFIQNASYYSASKYFDNKGKKQTQNRYRKYELNPYFEYGLSDRLTLGANIFLQRASQYDTTLGTNRINYGIGDSEFFVRSQIWKKNGFVFSAEPMIKLPSPERRSETPQIGSRNFDVGLGFSAGYGFKAWDLNHFINLDMGYRHRFGDAKDQLKFSATAGFSATKNIMLTAQVFNTTRLANPSNTEFTQSSGDDYNLTKVQVSTIYKMDEKLSFALGAFMDVDGKNVGSGSGTIVSVNKEF